MGKTSTTSIPSTSPKFTPSIIRYGGIDIAKTYKDKSGNIITEYFQSEEDKALDEWRKSQIAELEPQINVFSQDLQDSWKEIATANKNQALDEFNSMWDPIARSTKEDLWARGLSNSSIAADTQYNQDKIKSKAIESIANDYVSELQTLQNNELNNRYAYLNYLNGGIDSMSEDSFKTLYAGITNSSSANAGNTEVWKTLVENYNNSLNSSSSSKGWFYPLF